MQIYKFLLSQLSQARGEPLDSDVTPSPVNLTAGPSQDPKCPPLKRFSAAHGLWPFPLPLCTTPGPPALPAVIPQPRGGGLSSAPLRSHLHRLPDFFPLLQGPSWPQEFP